MHRPSLLTSRRTGTLGLVAALALLFGCESSEARSKRECDALRQSVHDGIDADLAALLRRGPDDAYYAALGLANAQGSAASRALAEQAGLSPSADDDLAARRRQANANFRVNTERASLALHDVANRRLVRWCLKLPDADRACVAKLPALARQRTDEVNRSCEFGDAPCREKATAAFNDEHPECRDLEARVAKLLAE